MTDLNLIYQEITNIIKQSKLPLFAVFDFDNTCIVNDITETALAYMARNNLFKDKNLLGDSFKNTKSEIYSEAVFNNYYQLLEDDKVKEAYGFISKILSGFNINEVSSLASNVIDFEGGNITTGELFGRKIIKGITLQKNTIDLMNFLKNYGIEVWIVSASLELLVKEAMNHFNIQAKAIGVKNLVTDNIITPYAQKPMSMFKGKVACIKKYIGSEKRPLVGIGDSINDLPMLEYCQIKVVIDHQDDLTKKAKENNWFILTCY